MILYRGLRVAYPERLLNVERVSTREHNWWSTRPAIALIYASTKGVSEHGGKQVLLTAECDDDITPTGKIGQVRFGVPGVPHRTLKVLEAEIVESAR